MPTSLVGFDFSGSAQKFFYFLLFSRITCAIFFSFKLSQPFISKQFSNATSSTSNMHISAVLASIIAVAKLVSSAPADPTSTPSPVANSDSSCVVPLVLFTGLDKSFTLSALTPDPSTWPVQLDTPSKTVETQPYISRTKIAQPLFRLTGGNLTTIGRGIDSEENWKNAFSAYFGPKIQIFPPVPDPIFFGGPYGEYSGFQAGYNCDQDGNVYLELRAGEC